MAIFLHVIRSVCYMYIMSIIIDVLIVVCWTLLASKVVPPHGNERGEPNNERNTSQSETTN